MISNVISAVRSTASGAAYAGSVAAAIRARHRQLDQLPGTAAVAVHDIEDLELVMVSELVAHKAE